MFVPTDRRSGLDRRICHIPPVFLKIDRRTYRDRRSVMGGNADAEQDWDDSNDSALDESIRREHDD
ncbi:hypothetical protein [Propionivibrio dicarboxylicus]|uniref:Uncharacterized protein n=1 Tax=Propionivibrio dicarboxylicus TaxID=83767 RepID=A0A1G8A9H6_9RHOO|nr:hypothetical protein [Propionivibrio dicarboxylicus]SDH17533.1 hypothetical protein SAMN05660652_01320 [Propionivibrio dicarboxylicus]